MKQVSSLPVSAMSRGQRMVMLSLNKNTKAAAAKAFKKVARVIKPVDQDNYSIASDRSDKTELYTVKVSRRMKSIENCQLVNQEQPVHPASVDEDHVREAGDVQFNPPSQCR
jgi:hypothetical protein